MKKLEQIENDFEELGFSLVTRDELVNYIHDKLDEQGDILTALLHNTTATMREYKEVLAKADALKEDLQAVFLLDCEYFKLEHVDNCESGLLFNELGLYKND